MLDIKYRRPLNYFGSQDQDKCSLSQAEWKPSRSRKPSGGLTAPEAALAGARQALLMQLICSVSSGSGWASSGLSGGAHSSMPASMRDWKWSQRGTCRPRTARTRPAGWRRRSLLSLPTQRRNWMMAADPGAPLLIWPPMALPAVTRKPSRRAWASIPIRFPEQTHNLATVTPFPSL